MHPQNSPWATAINNIRTAKMPMSKPERISHRARPLSDREKQLIEQYYPVASVSHIVRLITRGTSTICDYAKNNSLKKIFSSGLPAYDTFRLIVTVSLELNTQDCGEIYKCMLMDEFSGGIDSYRAIILSKDTAEDVIRAALEHHAKYDDWIDL